MRIFSSQAAMPFPCVAGTAVCRVMTGSTYIPAGESGWELSAQTGDIGGKAEADYDSRTAGPLGVEPSRSTFVFATPCRLIGKDAWVAEKKATGPWADVRAYDAVDLVHWLELHPAVGHWVAVLTGERPAGLRQIEMLWEEWSLSTRWPMNADLALAGRDEETTKVLNWLYGD